jgi:hypothetical protein
MADQSTSRQTARIAEQPPQVERMDRAIDKPRNVGKKESYFFFVSLLCNE